MRKRRSLPQILYKKISLKKPQQVCLELLRLPGLMLLLNLHGIALLHPSRQHFGLHHTSAAISTTAPDIPSQRLSQSPSSTPSKELGCESATVAK